MAIKVKFPIRYKILAVLSTVVVAAVAFYLYLASHLFYEDKTLLIYELNQTNVRTLGLDVRTTVERNLDKLKLIAGLIATKQSGRQDTLSAIFSDEDEVVKVAVLEQREGHERPVRSFVQVWPEYLESYGKDPAYLNRLRERIPVPFEKVQAQGVWVRNATLDEEGAPPLMTIASAVDMPSGAKSVIYADVRLDKLLEVFAPGGVAQVYATDSEGKILAHSNHELVLGANEASTDALLEAARASNVRSEVKRFEEGGRAYLGSYYRTGLADVLIASRVEAEQAFAAAERLIRKSLIYALVIITTAFLVALFFSHSLTMPIHRLLEATQHVARGDFNRVIHISSHDELATLAASFNSMTADLRSSHEQIQEYSRDLEKKVQDRTSRLEAQNVAIKEAQEALVRTTRLASVGEIAGRAAHEVLNPLTNITARLEKIQAQEIKADGDDLKLFTEITAAWDKDFTEKGTQGLMDALSAPSQAIPGKTLLQEDLENLKAIASDLAKRLEQRRGDIEFLLRESSRINKIVNGMRQLTRVSGNRRPIEVHKVLNESLATMADVLGKHRIETEFHYCQDAPVVMADHDELIQVFSNLLRNSMQAIDSARRSGQTFGDPAKIWFTTAVVKRDSGQIVQIRVCDNGPGIPKDNFHQVFEPSFTTKSVEEGTGLGLSISRRFIRAFDGEIIVEKSEPAVETVFLIELPDMRENGTNA